MDDNIKSAGLIFMKVGLHAQESIEDIIKRKQREFDEAGAIFWGYGGSTCHPLTMVQPFAKGKQKKGSGIFILLQKKNSKHEGPPEVSKQYSDGGVNWQPNPKGIEVRGSRFAPGLDELKLEEFDVDIGDLQVGVGPNRGRRADKYLIGQADKGCFVYSPREVPIAPEEKIIKHIGLVARVKPPFAVFVKN